METTARDVIAKRIAEFMSGASVAYREHENCADDIIVDLLSAPEPVRLELAALLNPWRPIETAPKDDTEIDLWCAPDLRDHGSWFAGGWRWGYSKPPTHWCRLTAPPSEGKT